jgi:hypothetical protein
MKFSRPTAAEKRFLRHTVEERRGERIRKKPTEFIDKYTER